MGLYSEEWWFSNGNLAANQRAAVFEDDQNTLASIFSDVGLTTPLANPTTTDSSGVLTFYAADGSYWIFVGKIGTGDSVLATIGASPDNPVLSVNGESPDGGGNVSLSAADVGAQALSVIDALGDLYVGTGPDTTTRLPRGSNGEVLATNSAEPGGLEWIPAPGGAVDSVNGQTGVVVLTAGDVGADPAGAAAAAQAASQPLDTDLTAIAGLAATNDDIIQRKAGSWTNRSVAQYKVDLAYTAAEVGAIATAFVNAKGDLISASANDTPTIVTAGANGTFLAADSAQTSGLKWVTPTQTVVFTDDRNVLTAGTGLARLYNRFGADMVIIGAWASVGVQPTGAAILVDVHLNGTTIYTTQGNRPTVAISTNGGGISATPDVTAWAQGDYLTVDIDQIGSTIPGGLLTVGIVARYA